MAFSNDIDGYKNIILGNYNDVYVAPEALDEAR